MELKMIMTYYTGGSEAEGCIRPFPLPFPLPLPSFAFAPFPLIQLVGLGHCQPTHFSTILTSENASVDNRFSNFICILA